MVNKSTQNFYSEDLAPLNVPGISLEDAKVYFNGLIDGMCPPKSNHPINPLKAAELRRRVSAARDVIGLQSMAWNMFLSGIGLGNPNSRYQKKFK